MLKVRRTEPRAQFFEEIDEPRERLLRWAHRTPEQRRQRRAPIDHDTFHHSHLADLVFQEFSGSCAFCERPVDGSEGISHFRPLNLEGDDGPQDADHYSWLAYEWLNLFLICRRCQRQRGDRFYVIGRRARFLATFDEVRAEERPLLIDPTIDNPSSHLTFLFTGECFPKRTSSRGKATVDILGLNDDELIHRRSEAIEAVFDAWKATLQGRGEVSRAIAEVPFQGAWRDVLARTLTEFGIASLGSATGRLLTRRLHVLLERSDEDARERMVAAIDLVRESDRIRREELLREPAPEEAQGYFEARAPASEQALRSPRAEIVQLQIRNFKAIDSLDISLRPARSRKSGAACLMLLGENAVGKSTCLSAIALALLGTREARKLRLRYSELARSASRHSWDIWGRESLEVLVHLDRSAPAAFLYDPVRARLDGEHEQATVVLGYGPHRYFAPTRGRRGTSAAHGVRSLFDPRQPLPDPTAWLGDLKGRNFEEVARTIRMILPIGDEDQLVNDPRSGISVQAQGQLTPVSQLSEGYRSIFAMVADICRTMLEHWSNLETAHGVVLIDEIDTHLHPRWKMQVMSSLRRAFPRVQFIVTTHDPLCVRGMDDGEVIVLARDDEGGIMPLADLPSISGMRAEQLLTSEYFGLSSTVNPEVQLEIARLAEGVADDPARVIGEEADSLISRLTVGDSAAAQVIQEALLRYLQQREKPVDALAPNARADAVDAVFHALRASRGG